MAIKLWSLFENFKLSELNNNFAELNERTSNINNTSDATKNVLSATKLTTARTINGVGFDGTTNISITANPTQNYLLLNTDLNTMLNTGFYSVSGGNTCANKPSGIDAFGLIVYKSAYGYVTQDLVEGSINPQKRWSRQYSGSGWTSWIEIYTTRLDGSETPTALNLGTVTAILAKRSGNTVRFRLEAKSGAWTGDTLYGLCRLSLNYRPVVAFSKRIMLTETINALFLIGTDGYVYIKPSGSINDSELRIDETFMI